MREKIAEWVGFKHQTAGFTDKGPRPEVWRHPDGNWSLNLPDLDLNFLFKWAVPKARAKYERMVFDTLMHRWIHDVMDGKDPAQALAQAILKVIEEGK